MSVGRVSRCLSVVERRLWVRGVVWANSPRTAWLTSKVRLDPSFKTFFNSAKTFTWWYLLVTHPRTVFKLMIFSVKKGGCSKL